MSFFRSAVAVSFFYVSARITGFLDRRTSLSLRYFSGHTEFCDQHPAAPRVSLQNGDGTTWSSFVRIDDVRIGAAQFSLYVLESDGARADFVSYSIATHKVWFSCSPALTRAHSFAPARTSQTWESTEIQHAMDGMRSFCKRTGLHPSEALFLDIGSNLGTFSMAMAALGYRAIAFEAMPINQKAIKHSACANNFQSHLHVIESGVGRDQVDCQIYVVKQCTERHRKLQRRRASRRMCESR